MKTYKLYTQDMNREFIRQAANARFDAYTVTFGVGVWRGVEESTLMIEIISLQGEILIDAIRAFAEVIRQANEQECILLTVTDGVAEFI